MGYYTFISILTWVAKHFSLHNYYLRNTNCMLKTFLVLLVIVQNNWCSIREMQNVFFLLFHSSCLPQFEYLFCSQSLVGTQVHDKILNNVGSHISNSTTFQQWVNEIGKELSKTGQIMKKVDWEYFFSIFSF